MNQGYYSNPTISETQIAFISDDDLWSVSTNGGVAQRLTANKGPISSPCYSPDGKQIAFLSTDTNIEPDVYIMAAQGGEAQRLTWLGVSKIISWKDNKTVYFTSGIEGYPRRETHVYELNIETRDFKKVNLGPASFYYNGGSFQVLARNSGDPARWKRYQGGTAGVIWTQQKGKKFQKILKNIKTNITKPEVINNNIYFISDQEGVGNIYTCDISGNKLKRLTHHTEYYCRNLRSNKNTLVYQCGAEIHTLNITTGKETKIDISCSTTAIQTVAKFDNWGHHFEHAAIKTDATEMCLVSRGHLFNFPPFSGAVQELDHSKDIRYAHPQYNLSGTHIIAAGGHGESEEQLYSFNTGTKERKVLFPKMNWGKIWSLKASPKKDVFALINNRNEIYLLDLKSNTCKKIESNKHNRPAEPDWSPDGRYLAYTSAIDARRSAIRIYDTKTSDLKFLINPVCMDYSPSFDPEGKYLYFLSVREFAPNYNETHFDLGFAFATRPYVVSLNANTANPFEKPYENPKITNKDESKNKDKNKKSKEELNVEIEFEGMENRILAFPLDLGGYAKISAIAGGVIYSKSVVEPITDHDRFSSSKWPDVYMYKFEDGSNEIFQSNVRTAVLNSDKTQILMFTDSKLRLIETKSKPTSENTIGKKDGFVDGTRIKLKVNPRHEWQQMYHEAWVLQKEHFWRKDLSKIDWKLVYERYKKLLSKVKTRSEFSDLMWEMQGELGTSHCYEMLGDYTRWGACVPHARLGAYFSYDHKNQNYKIERILNGDSWIAKAAAPLTAMGVNLKEGDKILAVDGLRFNSASDLYEAIENKSDIKIALTVKRNKNNKEEVVQVKTAKQLSPALYRDWVEKNKNYVHTKSNGKLGYVHVPDMGSFGYSEFYRHFIVESDYEGLVVDVRYNGGGHVSQHLLKVLAQKVIGFDETRHQGVFKYPMYAPGVLVALANEHSGSDGDIFPHSFKLMKLGKLIGKRTWGGIIGINGQYSLRDGSYVTQPEYSFWFKDNEWYVENHGVEPDIEVEITPEDYRDGLDPQLDRAIKEALSDLKRNPNLKFKPSYYPDLSIPKKLQKLK